MSDKIFDNVKKISQSSDRSAKDLPGFKEMMTNFNGVSLLEQNKPEDGLRKGDPDYEHVEHESLFGKLGMMVAMVEIYYINATGKAATAIEQKKINELEGDAEIMKQEKAALALVTKAQGEANAMNTRREARQRYVEDTIVVPTGGRGPQVADVLVSENVASSQLKAWGAAGSRTILTISSDNDESKKNPE
jgi:hypothetical protein